MGTGNETGTQLVFHPNERYRNSTDGIPDTHPFISVPRIHSFAARAFRGFQTPIQLSRSPASIHWRLLRFVVHHE